MKSKLFLIILIVMAFLLTGCQAPKPSALSNDQVVQTVDHFLQSTKADDYQSAIRDFSDQMKSVYTQAQFDQLRELLQKASGSYLYCPNAKPSLSDSQGYAVYHLTCNFEKENVAVTITYKIGGDKIEGLYFTSVNLVKQSK